MATNWKEEFPEELDGVGALEVTMLFAEQFIDVKRQLGEELTKEEKTATKHLRNLQCAYGNSAIVIGVHKLQIALYNTFNNNYWNPPWSSKDSLKEWCQLVGNFLLKYYSYV